MNSEIFIYSSLLGFFLFASLLTFVYYRGLSLLQFFQQEEYDNDRFLLWLFRSRAFD